MPDKKLKILLLQLPFPLLNRSANEQLSTIPLAAGYLKAMARKDGLDDSCDIEILEIMQNEFAGDALLVDRICSGKPDVLGFSFYVWNINRSLFIIKEIKSRLPRTKVIIGGPGITREFSFIKEPGVDIAVIGEGEAAFAQILRYLVYGAPRLKEIPGICYKTSGGQACTAAALLAPDANDIPSPYLSGCIDPGVYKRIWIETMRWCVYKCKYCLYPVRSRRRNPYYFPQRVEREIAFARQRGVRIIDLHDSAFNLSPYFNQITDALAKSNRDKFLKLKVFLRAELVTPKTIRQLLKSNVVGTEVGLQSINPVALANIGRQNDFKKFIRGVNLLKQAGIGVLVDIMVGLPGDTLQTITRTLNFLKVNNLDSSAAFTILSVCPSTPLWEERKKLGLRIQRQPPYYVLETPTLSFSQMKQAIDLCTKRTVGKLQNSILNPGNNAFFPFMYTYSSGRYSSSGRGAGKPVSSRGKPDRPITTLVFHLEDQPLGKLKQVARRIENKLANNVVAWFNCVDISKDAGRIAAVLEILSRGNPYAIWHIILETEALPAPKLIAKIQKSIYFRVNHWDYQNVFAQATLAKEYLRQAARIVAVVPLESNRGHAACGPEGLVIFRSVYIEDIDAPGSLGRLAKPDCAGLLIDFSPKIPACSIIDCFKFLRLNKGAKIIRFRNRLLQTLWDTGHSDMSVCTAGALDLIFSYDRELKEQTLYFTQEKIKFDHIDWMLSLGKQ